MTSAASEETSRGARVPDLKSDGEFSATTWPMRPRRRSLGPDAGADGAGGRGRARWSRQALAPRGHHTGLSAGASRARAPRVARWLDRGERGGRERGGRDRGGRGDRGGRDRDRGGRDRGGREFGGREREREEAPVEVAAAEPVGPSIGTARGDLGTVGDYVKGLIERIELGPFEIERIEQEGVEAPREGPAALGSRAATGARPMRSSSGEPGVGLPDDAPRGRRPGITSAG
jgi:hypothetical protein